jgi:DNA replication protein DnaC
MRALCARLPRLLQELGIARADGTYTVALARLAKLDVLVLDDFLISVSEARPAGGRSDSEGT